MEQADRRLAGSLLHISCAQQASAGEGVSCRQVRYCEGLLLRMDMQILPLHQPLISRCQQSCCCTALSCHLQVEAQLCPLRPPLMSSCGWGNSRCSMGSSGQKRRSANRNSEP